VPATTAKATPSRIVSIAAAVASRALRIVAGGRPIEPEQSTITTTAAAGAAPGTCPGSRVADGMPPEVPQPAKVTVTMARTSRPPSGRYSFW
jgi:hypothetical protein